MMNENILEKFLSINEEEQQILDGNSDVVRMFFKDKYLIDTKLMIQEGKLIAIRKNHRFIDFPPHVHDYIEVVYVCAGEMTHIVNGNTVKLKAGELLFLGKNAIHETKRAEYDDIAVNFMILPQFFDKTLDMLGEEETPLKRFIIDYLGSSSSGADYLHFKVTDVLPVQNLVENLIYTLVSDTSNKRNIDQITMGLLILQLLNNTDRLSLVDESDSLLVEIFRFIEENYVSGELSTLAEKMHFDLYWLSREIKRKTGKTYTELLQEKRLSQATFLLKNTKMNISDVSYSVGYENISYFHKIFSKAFGMSPKKYRDCN